MPLTITSGDEQVLDKGGNIGSAKKLEDDSTLRLVPPRAIRQSTDRACYFRQRPGPAEWPEYACDSGSADLVRTDEADPHRVKRRLRAALQAELAEDVADVRFHGSVADP